MASTVHGRAAGRSGGLVEDVLVRRLPAVVCVVALLGGACGGTEPEELDAVRLPVEEVSPTPDPTEQDGEEPAEPVAPITPSPTDRVDRPEPAPSLDPEPSPSPAPSPSPTGSGSTLPDSLRGAEWERLPTGEKVVALTFDAGANADAVPSILATLADEGVGGTFFLTGRWTEQFPDLARRIAERHPIGNHSVSHPEFTSLSDAAVVAEVDGAERTIRDVAGVSTKPLFRFPFGDRDARTIGLVNDAGYGSIRWTIDTLGWKGTSDGMTVDGVVERVLGTARAGQIVLMHVGSHPTDGSTLDADALPRIIRELRALGYRFVTLPGAVAAAS
jgi:peptidoglycan/xylan/chitin deacetylase (PgdA/CDA1 family)